jgi:hypothetical protein
MYDDPVPGPFEDPGYETRRDRVRLMVAVATAVGLLAVLADAFIW